MAFWIAQTERRLGRVMDGEPQPIVKGGSDRRYFRLRAGGQSVILTVYGTERAENELFVPLAHLLGEAGVRVPRILAHDPAARLIWTEDLGTEDLHSHRAEDWTARRELYADAISQMMTLHDRGTEWVRRAGLTTMPGFDAAMYAWERDYFYRECVQGACGLELPESERQRLEEELSPGADLLLRGPQVLVHRDYQSQNILIHQGVCYLIDFQGARMGSPFYDLASLLLDPYVDLPAGAREEMLGLYCSQAVRHLSAVEAEGLFSAAGCQRLMQALGAYGFLGLQRSRPAFLAHLQPALEKLAQITRCGLPCLHGWVMRCQENWQAIQASHSGTVGRGGQVSPSCQ